MFNGTQVRLHFEVCNRHAFSKKHQFRRRSYIAPAKNIIPHLTAGVPCVYWFIITGRNFLSNVPQPTDYHLNGKLAAVHSFHQSILFAVSYMKLTARYSKFTEWVYCFGFPEGDCHSV